jgi:hypothetical protein
VAQFISYPVFSCMCTCITAVYLSIFVFPEILICIYGDTAQVSSAPASGGYAYLLFLLKFEFLYGDAYQVSSAPASGGQVRAEEQPAAPVLALPVRRRQVCLQLRGRV